MMTTYLLTNNPARYDWDVSEDIAEINDIGYTDGAWSCGNNKSMQPGDRFFMIRLGVPPRGIIASGTIMSSYYEEPHWNEEEADKGKTSKYVDIRIETLLDASTEPILTMDMLQEHPVLAQKHWSSQISGILIPDDVAVELEKVWSNFVYKSTFSLPEEIRVIEKFSEGHVRQIQVNRYERNFAARRKCIEHYGATCVICGFNFAQAYGHVGQDYIHVHHLKSLADIGEAYMVDPIKDLRPVCPNCHAIIHQRTPAYSIEEVKAFIAAQQKQTP